MATAVPVTKTANLPAAAAGFSPKIPIRARYDNWIGGEYVAADPGAVLHQSVADHRAASL